MEIKNIITGRRMNELNEKKMDKETKEHECIGFRRDFIRKNHSPQESNLKENDDFLDVIKNTPVDTSNLSDKIVIDDSTQEAILDVDKVKEFIKKLFNKRRKEKGGEYGQEVIEVEDLFKLAGDKLI